MAKPEMRILILVYCSVISWSLLLDESSSGHFIPIVTVPDLVQRWGYPVEEHFVTTPDGYILAIHRIPHGLQQRKETEDGKRRRIPVFLGHCLVGSSAIWTFGPPRDSLAYILADEGYDVWMPNVRGSSYSRNHTELDPSRQEEFWEFGFEESAIMDYSTSIDFILEQTGQEDLFFVGYSMGTTQYLILLSERPEYNAKIRAGFLLGPTAFGGNSSDSLVQFSNQAENIKYALDLLSIREFLPNFPEIKSRLAQSICCTGRISAEACLHFFSVFLGMDPGQINAAMVPVYMSYMPAGSSVKQLVHYAQLFRNGGRFAKFDYGRIQNLLRYGSSQPPEFLLDRISVPTVLFSGKADVFSTPQDSRKLASELPSLLHHELLGDPDWGHMHFIWSVKARDAVYEKNHNYDVAYDN